MGHRQNDSDGDAEPQPRRVLDDAPLIGTLHWTLTGGVNDANDVFLDMLGYDRDDLRAGRINWHALTPSEGRASDAHAIVQLRARGKHEPFEKEFCRKNGERIPVLIGSALYPGSQSEGVSFVLDLSARKTAEQAALERTVEQRVAGVLESITDAFVAMDADGTITYMNANAARLARGHRNDFIGRTHAEAWPATVGSELERQYQRVAETGVPATFENFYDDGQTPPIWFLIRAFPGVGGGVNVFYSDITDEKAAQAQAERAAADLRVITDAAPLLISYIGADLRYRFVNRSHAAWFGLHAREIVGRTVPEIIGQAAFEASRAYIEAALRGERISYETEMPYDEGRRTRFIHADMVPDKGEDGAVRGYVAVVADISERRQAENEARERGDEIITIFETMTDAFLALDGAWRFTYINAEAERLLQRTRADLMGKVFWDELPEEGDAPFEAAYRRAVRENVPLSVEAYYPPLDEWFEARAYPSSGNGLSIYFRNVSERKRAEQEREALLNRQRQFLRDMVFSLTEGKFRLCLSEADLPVPLPPASDMVPLGVPTLRTLRKRLNAVTGALGFAPERAQDIETGVGEAAMNAVTHGGGGEGWVCADPDTGAVQVWVRDTGGGISEEALPRVLEKGVSTAGTLGHGFWLMLRACDRVHLLTGATGTTVVLEQERVVPQPPWLRSAVTGDVDAPGG